MSPVRSVPSSGGCEPLHLLAFVTVLGPPLRGLQGGRKVSECMCSEKTTWVFGFIVNFLFKLSREINEVLYKYVKKIKM